MLSLFLLRHAKSAWDDPALDDHDRPLNKRGRHAADAMGTWMAGQGIRLDLVLCSTALRACQTLDGVLPHLGTPEVMYESGLYLASSSRLIARIRGVERGVAGVLLIGHEPGIGQAAVALTRPASAPDDFPRMQARFPTGALAWIAFDAPVWPDIELSKGCLKKFIFPKLL
ncbi:MAG: histidine phosphatase family protein [Alphaproteobacteria bacterium]|nr:histidine phosphatase family protein [Alphaproteobacteria bacterium]